MQSLCVTLDSPNYQTLTKLYHSYIARLEPTQAHTLMRCRVLSASGPVLWSLSQSRTLKEP